ncbi:MAG: succinylglutamate desuccinylase/aspartoacylase family protein [Gammaproteobacteria bacterium]|nr:succinylglutamate desuccinylase/aspartoacylase family protein [Gammaproteobacteria bacterium]
MREVGVCPNFDTEPAVHEPRLLYAGGDHQLVFARAGGLFEPVVELGEEVETGQLGAWIHTPEQPWRESQPVHFETAGVVICRRALAGPNREIACSRSACR